MRGLIRHIGPVWIIPFISLSLTSAGLAQEAATEDAVREAFAAFSQAYVLADTAVLEQLLVKDYVHVNGGSGTVIGRQEWLDYVASRRRALVGGSLVVDTYEVEDLVVKMHGDVAVLTGIVKSTGVREGEPYATHVRFTNVWVQDGTGWRRAAFHDSSLPLVGDR